MRELKLVMSVSLDGFVSGAAGEVDWMFTGDQAAIAWKVENAWNASLHLMGSRTFQGMANFWPKATSPFAAPMNQIPKAVCSAQGPALLEAATASLAVARAQLGTTPGAQLQAGADSWANATVVAGPLGDAIARLKAHDGKPIIAHGGATFARSLIAHDLVDEYVLGVYPIVLGKGVPIFDGLGAPMPLLLVGSRAFPSGFMAQTYRRA
ncbi:dihydrofolate reductase family protein [Xanthomonas axonopodis pv. poinsettiicola]|uniref:dihydrofolate reductase family protein n=1 Tax=Xanthomonas TaxID=338 RepID=UPI001E4DDD41|nr:dihydrofolate reductase family protein [Xanthomonas codiaei]MCC8537045.1 dihydrofolate reductase family protein [Xanthomonas codiaei]